jgi:small subunit ribosomal protein S6
MRVYEELFIIKPDAPEEEIDAFIEQIKQVIVSGKGTVDKTEKWGVRKLAYRVQKWNEGAYVLVQFSSSPELVKEVERRLRVTDMVIKFITVRIDEKLKKIEKRKKARDKRAARRPPPQVAAPAAPLAPAVLAEHAAAPGLPAPATSRETVAEPKEPVLGPKE